MASDAEETMEKAKKRLNIIDIIAVVVILAAVVFVGYKLMDRGGDTVQPEMVKVTYKVKKEGVPAEMYENSKKHLPSKLMASGAFVGGEIIDVEEEPYYVLGPDGEWILDETHTTLIFTAVTEVAKSNVMLTKVGEQEVRVGKEHILKSEYIEFIGCVITDVQWGE